MLKNLTVTLPEETLQAVRLAAAHAGMSMSKWLGRLIDINVDLDSTASIAVVSNTSQRKLGQFSPLPKASVQLTDENGDAPTKEWMNDRESLRRFERPDLHFGPEEV